MKALISVLVYSSWGLLLFYFYSFFNFFLRKHLSSKSSQLNRALDGRLLRTETQLVFSPFHNTFLAQYVWRRQWHPTPVPLAWKIPWMEEPGRLQSMGSLRVGHDWATSLSLFTFMHWRRKWQPTPVFLLGESQGRGSLVGCRLWGRTESETTEVT